MKRKRKKVGEPPHRRTKWSPQAKWRPTNVGGGESRGAPASEDQLDPAKMVLGWTNSVAEVGVSPTERQVSDCQDGLSPQQWDLCPSRSGSLWSVACPESIDCCGSSHGKGTMGDW